MAPIALTLGLLLALVVALLGVPLTVAFSIKRVEKTRGVVGFRWLFGLVRFRLRIPRPAGNRPPAKPAERKKPSTPGHKKPKDGSGKAISLIKQSAVRRRVYRFIRDLLRATHARDVTLRLRIGLGDPADTGRLWAIVGPVAGTVQNLCSVAVRIEPEFIDPVFEVESHGRFRLVPLQFIAIAAAFALSPTMLPVWWRLSRGNA